MTGKIDAEPSLGLQSHRQQRAEWLVDTLFIDCDANPTQPATSGFRGSTNQYPLFLDSGSSLMTRTSVWSPSMASVDLFGIEIPERVTLDLLNYRLGLRDRIHAMILRAGQEVALELLEDAVDQGLVAGGVPPLREQADWVMTWVEPVAFALSEHSGRIPWPVTIDPKDLPLRDLSKISFRTWMARLIPSRPT